MVKRHRVRSEARTRARDYLRVAADFVGGADSAMEFDYANAAGVLYVHAAIAFADAVCIALSGKKSGSEDHEDVIDLLKDALPQSDPADREALNAIGRVISVKTSVSYEGRTYTRKEITPLKRRVGVINQWACARVRRAGI